MCLVIVHKTTANILIVNKSKILETFKPKLNGIDNYIKAQHISYGRNFHD